MTERTDVNRSGIATLRDQLVEAISSEMASGRLTIVECAIAASDAASTMIAFMPETVRGKAIETVAERIPGQVDELARQIEAHREKAKGFR